MTLYWQERKAGERLILALNDESEEEVGAVRRTPRGFDALAKTNTYDPGRAQKGFETIEEAKAFVESFHPWDLFGGDMDMEVEPEVRRLNEASTEEAEDTPVPAAKVPSEPAASVEAHNGTEGQAAEADDTSVPTAEVPSEPAASVEVPNRTEDQAAEAQAEELPQKRGWQFWKKG